MGEASLRGRISAVEWCLILQGLPEFGWSVYEGACLPLLALDDMPLSLAAVVGSGNALIPPYKPIHSFS